MKKFLLIATALLITSSAHADFRVTTANGYQVGASCYRSFYGTTCRTWESGNTTLGTNARVVPVDIANPNTNPDWGKGCRSCYDATK